MSKVECTPGPWHVAGDETGYVMAQGETPVLVAVVGAFRNHEVGPAAKARWAADAALIAAAPDLLAALREMLDPLASGGFYDNHDEALAMLRRASAAIARAEGRVP